MAQLLVREWGLDSPERLQVISDKNVNDIYNVIRNQAARMPKECPKGGNRSWSQLKKT